MAPPKLRFKTQELIMWINQRNAVSDEKSDSTLEMENRFRVAGIGESE
jgi:hypothetical protein